MKLMTVAMVMVMEMEMEMEMAREVMPKGIVKFKGAM